YTRGLKPTKLFLSTDGNYKLRSNRKEKGTWLESSPWKRHVILVLWHILMPVRQQPLNVFFSIQDVFISWEKHMKVLQKWTGWSRRKTEGSPLLLRQQQLSGKTIV